jgi:hypothetical protein
MAGKTYLETPSAAEALAQTATNRLLRPADLASARMVAGMASGYKLARGSVAATASKAVTTGLSTIVGFAATLVANTATKINQARAVSATASSGTLTIKRWKHTGPSTATLVAATVAGTVEWVAVGT